MMGNYDALTLLILLAFVLVISRIIARTILSCNIIAPTGLADNLGFINTSLLIWTLILFQA